ncbi:MAG: hypothetical protein AAGC79_05425 [Pseudomonadota bacterium]
MNSSNALKFLVLLACFTIADQPFAQAQVSPWREVWEFADRSLTSAGVTRLFAGNSLDGVSTRGNPYQLYFTEDMTAYSIHDGKAHRITTKLLEHGLFCWIGHERQICYRVYARDDRYALVMSNGHIVIRGQVLDGNAFGVEIQ